MIVSKLLTELKCAHTLCPHLTHNYNGTGCLDTVLGSMLLLLMAKVEANEECDNDI
jgi:hypothetical protein